MELKSYKVIGGDQQEYGPADAQEIRQWIADGRLSYGSRIRGVNEADWRNLEEVEEFGEALRAQAAQLGPAPKPPPITRVPAWEPGPAAGPAEISVGRCLSLGWELMTSNFALIFGATFIVWSIGLLCQLLPLGIFYWFIRGVLYGGLCLIILRRIRGQDASIGDVFSGFRVGYWPLLFAGVLTPFLSWLALFFCLLPGIYLFIGWLFSIPLIVDKQLQFWPAMETSRRAVTRVWFKVFALVLVAYLPVLLIEGYLQVKFSVALYAAMQGMTPQTLDFPKLMEAMKQVAVSSIPLMLAGKAVLLFNLPFGLAALLYAYESLFGSRSARPR